MHRTPKADGVAWRMTGGVVVEVGKDLASVAPLRCKPCAPGAQNAVIVATRVFGRSVEAHINERADHDFSGPRPRHIVEAERDASALEQLEHVVVVPAWFTELDHVLPPLRKRSDERGQPLDVGRPVGRELVQNRAERPLQALCPLKQTMNRLRRILELFHVSQKPTGFHGIQKARRCLFPPRGECQRLGEAVERVVDLDSIELRRVVRKPL